MFSRIFGRFLIDSNLISKEDLSKVLECQKNVRVKLGLIAVAQKLITTEDAHKINQRQLVEDKRFGDIAVEQGYLSDEQVLGLLKLQGNPYLSFVQVLEDNSIMTIAQVNKALAEFQSFKGFSDEDIEAFKNGDNEHIVSLFVKSEDGFSQELAALAIRTIVRLIDDQVAVDSSYVTNEYVFENLAGQSTTGKHGHLLALCGKGNSLLPVANIFAREEFDAMDEDSFDSLCEFINCINGLYATYLSGKNISSDILPPVFYQNQRLQCKEDILVVPILVQNQTIDIVICPDSDMKILL